MKLKKRIGAIVSAAVFSVTTAAGMIPNTYKAAEAAAAVNYPVQEFQIGVSDTDRNINITGFDENAALNTWVSNGGANEKWSVNYVSDGVFEIVNSKTNKIITNINGYCAIANDVDGANQRWKVVGVDKDFNGQYLYYKIVSNQNNNLAMTFDPNGNFIKVSDYTGDKYQKFKLNCDGLEGFAGNCVVAEGEKAGTIGGLLGETVYVDTLDKLKSALVKDKPLTIVLTKNIDCSKENYDWRIEDNKTLVGSYGENQLRDCKLRTNDYYDKEAPSDNIIIRNMKVQVDVNKGMMALAIYSSKNVWVDHCTFNCSLTKEYNEVGKYIWINTPFSGKDVNRSPDFITLSYNSFNNRFWGVAFGTQNGKTNENRATVMYNIFDSIVQRCPQMGNGTMHVYNNYYVRNSSSIYDDGMAEIKCGEGSQVVSDSNRFEKFLKEKSGYWDNEVTVDSNASFKDSNSYTNKNENGNGSTTLLSISGNYNKATWSPSQNYGYSIVSAYNSSNTDIKALCAKYSGCFKSYKDIQYITNDTMSKYVVYKAGKPFLKNVSVTTKEAPILAPTAAPTAQNGEVMQENMAYMFKNVTSGQYLEVAGASASNGANVQQWGANGASSHNTWKLKSAGNGYYRIYSCLGNGSTYMLDVANNSSANKANIGIYQNTNCDAQLFKFVKNSDGSYTILTKASNDASCVEVANNSTSSGANVQQYASNGAGCQKWVLESAVKCEVMQENTAYMFKNVTSGQYLEVAGASASNGANVQQWGANGASSHNTWTLKSAGNGYYRIYSCLGNGSTYMLDVANNSSANKANVGIYQNTNCDAQLFKFVKNSDGSYTILTKASNDASCVEVANNSTSSGANVQQYAVNAADCQKWELECPGNGEIMKENKVYMFENVNSGQYLEVANASASNGANVQQWGANGASSHNTWTLKSAGNGYYRIYSCLGDGSTYMLDVANNSSANKANIGIYQNTNCDAQLFKFIKNSDGSYTILTKASNDASCVEVANNSTSSGANVQQYAVNGADCQKWIIK